MSVKVFLTGGTGYVGGSVLTLLQQSHPSWVVTCLVRSQGSADALREHYPNLKIIIGDLDSTSIIETAASEADVIFHLASADHMASAQAISRGVRSSNSTAPRCWIHLSGALILAHDSIVNERWGETTAKIYDDWEGITELTTNMPDEAEHRAIDKVVISAGNERIKTAIVAPPLIYGRGIAHVGNRRSIQIERVSEAYLKNKRAFVIGRGENRWNGIHVEDLAALFLKLGEAAAEEIEHREAMTASDGNSERHPSKLWNEGGYYLAEDGEFCWRDIGERIRASINNLKMVNVGRLGDVEELDLSQAANLMRNAKYLMGTTSRGKSIRARNLLGWKPQQMSLLEQIPSIVEVEAARFGQSDAGCGARA